MSISRMSRAGDRRPKTLDVETVLTTIVPAGTEAGTARIEKALAVCKRQNEFFQLLLRSDN